MSFKEDLEQICGKVDGSFAASVMGFDGIPSEPHEANPRKGIELATLLVEYSGIISQVRQAAETLQRGRASEVSIRTEKMVAVARTLTSDYFRKSNRWSACARPPPSSRCGSRPRSPSPSAASRLPGGPAR